MLVDARCREGDQSVFGVPDRGRHAGRVDDLHEADTGLPGAEDGFGVGESPGAEDIHEQVVGQLLIRALIRGQVRSLRLLIGVDEPGSSPAGPQRRVLHTVQECRTFVIEDQ